MLSCCLIWSILKAYHQKVCTTSLWGLTTLVLMHQLQNARFGSKRDKLVDQWFHFHRLESTCDKHKYVDDDIGDVQGGRTCGAIKEASRSSKVNDERAIINFCDKNAVIAHFSDKNGVFDYCDKMSWYVMIYHDATPKNSFWLFQKFILQKIKWLPIYRIRRIGRLLRGVNGERVY